jgi:hypothetical protein
VIILCKNFIYSIKTLLFKWLRKRGLMV